MFGKRFHLLTLFNIKILIDVSWFFIAFLLTWTLAAAYFPAAYPDLFSQATYWVLGVGGTIGLFICILLHELGHAIVAKHYGLPISSITLFLFGGVAEIRKEPKSPKVELFVAVAGPLVTLLLIILFSILLNVGSHRSLPLPVTALILYLLWINTIILLFNLIPAFPLDGGRILRAILWAWKKDLGFATKIASRCGMGFGFILLFLGIATFILGNIIGGIWWIVLGWFLQRAAQTSETQLLIDKELSKKPVSLFMTSHPDTAEPSLTIEELVHKHVYTSLHHLYPVIQEGRFLGFITLAHIKALPKEEWSKVKVQEIMTPSSPELLLGPNTNALRALDAMQQAEASTLFVVEESRLIGLVSAQDLLKLISLKLELNESD